jgi:hypothetical protein
MTTAIVIATALYIDFSVFVFVVLWPYVTVIAFKVLTTVVRTVVALLLCVLGFIVRCFYCIAFIFKIQKIK